MRRGERQPPQVSDRAEAVSLNKLKGPIPKISKAALATGAALEAAAITIVPASATIPLEGQLERPAIVSTAQNDRATAHVLQSRKDVLANISFSQEEGIVEEEAVVEEEETVESPPTPEAEIEPPLFIDILSLPGWDGFPGVSRTEDGALQISTTGGTELQVRNSTDFVEVGPNGFEVMTKIRTVASPLRDLPGPIPVTGSIILYNRSPNERDALQIQIGLTDRNILRVAFVDMTQDPGYRVRLLFGPIEGLPIIQVPTEELHIEMVGSGDNERLNIYDGTGEIIAEDIRLPRPFFSEDSNQLYFGFYTVSGSGAQLATMTVESLQARSR